MKVWKAPIIAWVISTCALGGADAQTESNLDIVLKQIVPALYASGKVARIYYSSPSCDVGPSGADPAPFPRVNVLHPATNEIGLAAIQDAFRSEKDIKAFERPAGIVRIEIGHGIDDLLQTKISKLSFVPIDQYNVYPAIDATLSARETQAAMHRLNLMSPARFYSMIMQEPMEGRPHLPPYLKRITVDETFDEVAKTFNGIVLYGVCKKQNVFGVRFATIRYSEFLKVETGSAPK